jgi:uncharacterized protein DUF6790
MGVASQIWIVPIAAIVAAIVSACIAILRAPWPVTREIAIDKLLRYLFFFPLGLQSLWAFVGHAFFPEQSAAAIGWAPSPFQYEVAVANLGLGLASLYAAFMGFEARVAVAIVATCFLVGAGVGHIIDIAEQGNLAPGNAGPILVSDFLTPIAVLVLLLASTRPPEAKSPETLQLEAELEIAKRAMRKYRAALDDLGRE